MRTSTNFLRRLLPALLLASLALTSCGEDCKEDDPKPKRQERCPSTPPPATPSGNS